MTLNVINTKLSDLKLYENNAREHSKEQIKQIANSIKEFGFTNPILIDENHMILAGHGRYQAAKLLKLKEIPCIILENLSEEQKKAYVIADNQIALNATWDESLLLKEIDFLLKKDFNIDLICIDTDFIDKLLLDDFEKKEDQNEKESTYTDKIELPIYEPKGEQYQISELCDTSKTDRLMKKIENLSVDNEIKRFLRSAAHRHDKFNFKKIAEFYALCKDDELRLAFEESALVIIDYNKAMELGFLQMTKKIISLTEKDCGDTE